MPALIPCIVPSNPGKPRALVRKQHQLLWSIAVVFNLIETRPSKFLEKNFLCPNRKKIKSLYSTHKKMGMQKIFGNAGEHCMGLGVTVEGWILWWGDRGLFSRHDIGDEVSRRDWGFSRKPGTFQGHNGGLEGTVVGWRQCGKWWEFGGTMGGGWKLCSRMGGTLGGLRRGGWRLCSRLWGLGALWSLMRGWGHCWRLGNPQLARDLVGKGLSLVTENHWSIGYFLGKNASPMISQQITLVTNPIFFYQLIH